MKTETYWKRALEQSERALSTGALIPLSTSLENLIRSPENNFQLRTLQSHLPKHLKREGPKPNPFQPWDTRLEVARLEQDHAVILNKYPVQRGHMLLITTKWAAQDGWLQLADWRALAHVDHDTSGLWFFNSGPIAGASQPHRHLQLLPRSQNEENCPRDLWFQNRLQSRETNASSSDPLVNGCAVISRLSHSRDPDEQAQDLYKSYLSLSEQLGLGHPSYDQRPRSFYNLLLTPHWMAIVRRRREGAAGFSINALGFAGYLLATEKSDVRWLKSHGPEALLREVILETRGNTVVKSSP